MSTATWAGEPAIRELTLADCVGLALENHLELRIGKITREIARQEVDVARGGYDPQFEMSARRSYEQTEGDSAGTSAGALEVLGSETDAASLETSVGGETALGGLSYELGARLGREDGERNSNPFDTRTGGAGVTLTQPLLQGFKSGGVRYQVALARQQSAEAALQLETQLQNTLAEVETAWYALIQAREGIRVQEEAVRLAQQLYEDNRRRVQIGTLSVLDEKQAESQAAAARADLSSVRLAFAEAQNRLKTLLFADQRGYLDVEIAAAGELQALPTEVDAADASARALENRPDLRRARLALARQGLTVAQSRNQTLPALDLVGGAGVAANREDSTGDVVDQLQSADEPYWNAGVVLTFPLGNRAARNRYRQSQAEAEKLKLQLRQLEETALVEVANAVAAVSSGFERVQATREARRYAEEALAAEQRKLDHGRSTSFIVLQLQRNLTEARQAELVALAGYNRQMAELARAEGAMLARHGVEFTQE